jgi:hypothetical protein
MSASVRPGETFHVHVGLNNSGQSLANRKKMLAARVVWVNSNGPRINGKLEAGVEFLSSIAAHLDAA